MPHLRLSKLVILISFLSLGACSFKPLEFKKFDIENAKKDGSKTNFTGFLIIENPNVFGLKIKDANLEVRNESLVLGKANLLEKATLSAKQKGLVNFSFGLDNKALFAGGIMQFGNILSGKPIELRLEGKIKACSLGIFCKSYRVNEQIKIKL